MLEEKKTYYISLASGGISQSHTSPQWNYKIEATEQEITYLRELFDTNEANDWQSFFRAHIPYLQYHHDKENDAYDEMLKKAYEMIYELGDNNAKQHIAKMGIITTENE